MAAGNLDIVIPGADRGDEIGDLAKTVTVIRENAEQKARDEAEAKATQDQLAARQRKADMIKIADQFEGAVGEIVETVSSASTELESSATTLTSTAERAEELQQWSRRRPKKPRPMCSRWRPPPRKWLPPSTRSAARCRNWQGWPAMPSTRRARPTTASANCRRRRRGSATWSR